MRRQAKAVRRGWIVAVTLPVTRSRRLDSVCIEQIVRLGLEYGRDVHGASN